jgi:uncharacterized protein YgiB involved in biofilm formation
MKRSRHIALLTMGVSALALTACGGEPETVQANIYASIEECTAKAELTPQQCETSFNKAVDVHEASAKRYASKEDCEDGEGVGQCEKAPSENGDKRFRPSFIAFMALPAASGHSQPLYNNPNGQGLRTAGNHVVPASSGKATIPFQAGKKPGPAKLVTETRGGFGATAAKTGGGGGGGLGSMGS